MTKKKVRLLSTNLKSQTLKRVAEGLSTKLGYKVFRSSKPKPHRTQLLYGDQKDKIAQYKYFAEHNIPALEFTTDRNAAYQWWSDGTTVVGRKLTRASEGKGIVIFDPTDDDFDHESDPLPVYTKYKKKKKEFRVHVFKDKVVHVLEKRKKVGSEHSLVRNTANGYVFCSENVEEPEGLRELALKASKVTQSDFKGVDIGWNEKKQELFVIEVNSAPGIEGSNIDRYIKVITENL